MKKHALISILLMTAACLAPAADNATLLRYADDHTYGFYPYGFRGRDADGNVVYTVQSTRYDLVATASKATLDLNLPTSDGRGTKDAMNSPIEFAIEANGRRYVAVEGASQPDQVVLQRVGRFVQHVELRGLVLRDDTGATLDGVEAWVEIYAWSDRFSITFHATATPGTGEYRLETHIRNCRVHAFINPLPNAQVLSHPTKSETKVSTTLSPAMENGRVSIVVLPWNTNETDVIESEKNAGDALTLFATGVTPYKEKLPVAYDPIRGVHEIVLGNNPDINTMERVALAIENKSDIEIPLRLCFAKRGGSFGITGMSPVLCDAAGNPIGLPIQISKNWHCTPPWFDGLTRLQIPPKQKVDLTFLLAYANWGDVPAVSHAQLCLVGWGTHQLWDQMAIGSYGESITYDPDINLNRSMIDDVRPLMVWGMGELPQRQWSWTHNVGGGDFLVLRQEGKLQYLSAQKTTYRSQGPVLTDVSYTGETPDGSIRSSIKTQSWRSNDFVRGLYSIRYDVVKPVEQFDRLALFQLGADQYNTNIFTTISRGNMAGLAETWTPEMGGKKYIREATPFDGEQPWIAFTGSSKNPPPFIKEDDLGAWANRGLVLRSWKANLHNAIVETPHYAIYGSANGDLPSAVAEISLPPDCKQLVPGDFVEFQVEMVIMPVRAEEYYGPNEAFRAALAAHPDSWEPFHREAAQGQAIAMPISGELVNPSPIAIRSTDGNTVAVDLYDGAGFAPITFQGLKAHAPFELKITTPNGTQTLRSTDAQAPFWQTDFDPKTNTWSLTFTLDLTTPTTKLELAIL